MAVLRTLHIWAIRNTKKNLHKYAPHDIFPQSSSSLNFYSYSYFFYYDYYHYYYYNYNYYCYYYYYFKDGENSKIPLFLHCRQPNNLLKWKRVYYNWKAAIFKEIFPRE